MPTVEERSSIFSPISTFKLNFTSRPDETIDSFSMNRDGVDVWHNFKILFKDFLNQPLPNTSQALFYYDFKKGATDFEIEKEFGINKTLFIFESPIMFLSVLVGLLLEQWEGKSGPLLNNGHANLFYIRLNSQVIMICVHWDLNCDVWGVNAGCRNSDGWLNGSRVLHGDQCA